MASIILNRYEIGSVLGSGGMGTVYKGIDTQTGKPVAIKALKPEVAQPENIERFKREGAALRDLNHPNIVKILDEAEEAGQHYLVMEYISGGDLRSLIEKGAIPHEIVVDMAIDLADAFTRAHRLNIIHRDLKPANILLDENNVVRLTDFGLAHFSGREHLTENDAMVGTIAYLSPEVFEGEPYDYRGDIWAFGMVLFEMLTGKHPFKGNTVAATIHAILTQPIPNLETLSSDAPASLVNLVNRMLERDPQARIPSVRIIGAELESIQNGSTQLGLLWNPSNDAPVHNLPAQLSQFIGREQNIAAIQELMLRDGVRLVTLTGPGGIGKTRLSIEAAMRLLDTYKDGVFQVQLAPVSEAKNVALTIAKTLDVRHVGEKPILDILKEFLQGKEMLLLVDNFEHLIEASTTISELLQAAPRVNILITSRRLLNLRGEHEYVVAPLAVPELNASASPDEVQQYESVALFVSRAQAAKPSFAVTSDNLQHIVAICKQLDGIPLALELAAARVKLLPLQFLSARLNNRLTLLTGGARDLPTRQQTLRNAIDWSHSLLDADQQTLFSRLSVFVNGFSLESAEAVVNADHQLDVLSGVASLMANSLLLQRETASGEMRFGMLETIREYAVTKLVEAGEQEQIRRPHAMYFAARMDKTAPQSFSKHALKWLKWCDDEHDNLLAALRWAEVNRDEARVGTRLIFNMSWFWYRRGYLLEGVDWCNRILAIHEQYEPEIEIGVGFVGGAMLASWTGNLELAKTRSQQGIAILKQLEEGYQLAIALFTHGVVLLNQGKEAQARSYFDTSLPMFQALRFGWFATTTLMHLGNIELAAGNLEQANRRLDEALSLAQRVGDNWLTASVINNLGEMERVRGNYERAYQHYAESEAIYREMGDKGDVARLIHSKGYVALHQGDDIQAEKQFAESFSMFQIIGNKRGIAECVAGFARLALQRGQTDHAVSLLAGAQKVMDAAQAGWWPSDQAEVDAMLALARDRLDTAAFDAAWAEGQNMTWRRLFKQVTPTSWLAN